MLVANPVANTMRPNTNRGPPDDRGAPEPVGQPPHRDDAQDQEPARDPGHKDDGPGAHMIRSLDVGRENRQSLALQVVERDDDGQDDERPSPGLAQTLAQRHCLLAGPRQHVLRKQDILRRVRQPVVARLPDRRRGGPVRPRSWCWLGPGSEGPAADGSLNPAPIPSCDPPLRIGPPAHAGHA